MKPDARPWYKRRRLWIGGCLLLLVGMATVICLGAALIWQAMDPNSSLMKPSAVTTVREWARLEPLPVSLSEVHVTTKGSMMTREFEVSFEGDPKLILEWLKKSPGTQATCLSRSAPGDFHLEISPGGGAIFAEITVSKGGSRIVIRAYWS